MKTRCGWVKKGNSIYESYHDNEWGIIIKDDRAIFELFSLETQAAGLSWLTILQKKEGYRAVFHDFDIYIVARFNKEKIDTILKSDLIIRNRPKLEAIVENAKKMIEIIEEFGSLYNYFWGFINNKQIVNTIANYKNAPCTNEISDTITKDLKKRGFKFVGSVTVYAFMQACGMVDDHENSCFKRSK
ncbi:MAG: DNA-3-methyladenine glycosylase I [Campylobacterales bacterium]|nr:DNA-3-methyladenine glycosylase I [Campylobacterales bacterium]